MTPGTMIPPTNAIWKIITGNGSLQAESYRQAINFTGSGITITNHNSTNEIIFTAADSDFITVIKQADESITSDTTLSNDSQLFFSVSANTRYAGIVTIYANSGATPDFKYTFTLPAGATGVRSNGALSAGASAMASITGTSAQSTAGAFMLTIPFNVNITSTAGTVNFQWAQNTLDASQTIVAGGSNILVYKQ